MSKWRLVEWKKAIYKIIRTIGLVAILLLIGITAIQINHESKNPNRQLPWYDGLNNWIQEVTCINDSHAYMIQAIIGNGLLIAIISLFLIANYVGYKMR